MTYVMIAVFQIEELPDVMREFISSGAVKSVKPAYEGSVVKSNQKPIKTKIKTRQDRDVILKFIKDKGDVGYNDISSANLEIEEKSLGYNLTFLIDRGDLVRTGDEKPYRYKVPEKI
jgi:hypothetical protein